MIYTIRVYALLFTKDNEIVLLNETYEGRYFTKFPGGGMEKGEGTIDCIKRELKEELGLEGLTFRHFYTTDFYLPSVFDTSKQVISIYYISNEYIYSKDITFDNKDPKLLKVIYKPISELTKEDLTFPIDKKVVELLAEQNFI